MYLKPAASDAGSGDDGRVLHRAGLLEGRADRRDRRALLADGDVDAADLLRRVAGRPGFLLVDDRVGDDRRLAGLAVTDDELTLAAADRRHGVDGLDAGLQRLLDRLALDHGGRLQLEGAAAGGLDLAAAVDRVAQRVDDAAEVAVADGHGEHLAGAADLLALLDAGEVTQDDDADLAHVEVQRQTADAALELEQLVGHDRGQSLDTGDAVAGLGDDADLLAGDVGAVLGDVGLDGTADLVCGDRQLGHGSRPLPCGVVSVGGCGRMGAVSRPAAVRRLPGGGRCCRR